MLSRPKAHRAKRRFQYAKITISNCIIRNFCFVSNGIRDVTETQFQDGSTSYTHTFTGTGDGFAGNLTFPYGAEVSSATSDIAGEPSSTMWGNMTTNSDFGGAGTGQWSGTPPGFAYGSRSNLEVGNDQVQLVGNPTNNVNGMDRSTEATSTETINNTGGFAANGDQGFIGSTKPLTSFSLTSSSSNYRGFVIAHEDEYHSATYSSTSVYTTPIVKRYNSTTGSYIGTSSVSAGTCSYSHHYTPPMMQLATVMEMFGQFLTTIES